jgi:hypothetical protein
MTTLRYDNCGRCSSLRWSSDRPRRPGWPSNTCRVRNKDSPTRRQWPQLCDRCAPSSAAECVSAPLRSRKRGTDRKFCLHRIPPCMFTPKQCHSQALLPGHLGSTSRCPHDRPAHQCRGFPVRGLRFRLVGIVPLYVHNFIVMHTPDATAPKGARSGARKPVR